MWHFVPGTVTGDGGVGQLGADAGMLSSGVCRARHEGIRASPAPLRAGQNLPVFTNGDPADGMKIQITPNE
jgi:hypothetical protein